MNLHDALIAIVLGVVEGLTEFLPVSSTGHLILASSLLRFDDQQGRAFIIVVQLGAILAVCWEYRRKLLSTLLGAGRDPQANRLLLNLAIGFVPLAVLGLLFGNAIKRSLFAPVPVAAAFVVGALVILWAERREHWVRITDVDEITPREALILGLAQALALVPGTSRSGATIIGGLFLGLSRRAAAEFSFLLAVPTLGAATIYELFRAREFLSPQKAGVWGIGVIAAFVSAFLCVRWLLRFIATHDFTFFAWYRIVFGAVVLVTAWGGWVAWVAR